MQHHEDPTRVSGAWTATVFSLLCAALALGPSRFAVEQATAAPEDSPADDAADSTETSPLLPFAAEASWRPLLDAVRAGRVDAADRLLMDVLVDERPDDDTLMVAAFLAQEVEAPTALAEARTQATRRTTAGGSAAAGLARGYGALGTAIGYWRAMKHGSSIPMLFDEASERAASALAISRCADPAALLAARVHAALGRSDEAITVLAERRAAAAVPGRFTPILDLSEARLRYDRAVALPTLEDGKLAPAALADLEAAASLFEKHEGAIETLPLAPERRSALMGRRAWTSHRLGRIEEAAAAYGDLYMRDAEGQGLALRGLASLFAYDRAGALSAYTQLAARAREQGGPALDALADAELVAGDFAGALAAFYRRLALDERNPDAWVLGGRVFAGMEMPEEAARHLERALDLEPDHAPALAAFDALARSFATDDPQRAIALYERLVRLRPRDPFLLNNLGFVLREIVSPFTSMDEGGVQTLHEDAPAAIRAHLKRCVEVYEAAVAAIDPEADGQREVQEDWDLAGVINDCALMLHYFADVQDATRAESLYHRAMDMTEGGYMDAYTPNLQRLYTYVLRDRELAWYRRALQAQEAVLSPQEDGQGGWTLAPDEARRAAAAADAVRLRQEILAELGAAEAEESAVAPR